MTNEEVILTDILTQLQEIAKAMNGIYFFLLFIIGLLFYFGIKKWRN